MLHMVAEVEAITRPRAKTLHWILWGRRFHAHCGSTRSKVMEQDSNALDHFHCVFRLFHV